MLPSTLSLLSLLRAVKRLPGMQRYRNAIHRDLILTGELPTSIGKDFDFLMDMRDSGDYGGLIHVSLSDAQAAIETADRILSTVIPLC